MATVFDTMSDRLREIDFQIGGQVASKAVVESLFQVSFRALTPNPSLALLPRLCEEHLATALVASRQAIEERQAYFDAGDKFATLTLSLAGDTSAAALLASEADAMSLRHDISSAAAKAEQNTVGAVVAQSQQMRVFLNSVDPSAVGPTGDAARSKWLTYISRSVNHGFDGMFPFWGETSQTDQSPSGNQGDFVMSPRTPVVDLESELARRATFAAFRVTHDRAAVEQTSADAAVVAAQGRQATVQATEAFDVAAAKLAHDRSTAAAALLQNKLTMTRDLSLLDFKAQMELHRRRAQDLFREALERATAALTGLQTVYGFVLPDIPATALETAEDLLFWCRDVARILVGFDPRVVKQTVILSAQDAAGVSWRQKIAQGITIDAQALHDLGFVIRLRNASVRFTGLQRSGFPIKATTPGSVTDRDAQGTDRNVHQTPSDVRLVATSAADQDVTGRRTAARVVHNICPSGAWNLQASGVGSAVDDLLLDLDISYLVA
jgi:hypothetical protein